MEDIRIIKTKRALNKALAKLLTEIPYPKMSIIDICKEAKVHRATFYNYFKSKDDLFIYCIKNVNQHFIENFHEEKKISFSTRNELLNYVVDSYIDKCHKLSKYIKKVVEVQTPEKIYYVLSRSIYECLYQVLSLYPNPNQSMPKDFIANVYAGALTNIAFWYIENDNISIEEFTKYVKHYLNENEIQVFR